MTWQKILLTWGLVSSLAWSGLAQANKGKEPPAPPQLPEEVRATLDLLLQDYRAYGLPLPPEDAPLARYASGWRGNGDERHVSSWSTGFLLKQAEDGSGLEILVGPTLYAPEKVNRESLPEIVDPDTLALPEQSHFFRAAPYFEFDPSLAIAVQCHARGYDRLAAGHYQLGLLANPFGPTGLSRPAQLPDEPAARARALLAGVAWTHWLNEQACPGSDRAAALAQMKTTATVAGPALDDKYRHSINSALEAALQPSTATPGSVKAEIDALVDCGQDFNSFWSGQQDPRYQRLILRGFEAVPALIEHLDDPRLSRAVMQGFNNFATRPRRVGDIVGDILQAIAGEEFSRNWLRRQQGAGVDKAPVLEWWAKTQTIGEEPYLRSRVFYRTEKGEDALNTSQLAIIAERYPHLLPELYLELLEKHPDLESAAIARAITASSALPDEQKHDLFIKGAAHKRQPLRRAALYELRPIDPAAADAALVKALKSLPKNTDEPYWSAKVINGIPQLVMQSNSPEVGEAFIAAAKRAHVGLRMELLHNLARSDQVKERRDTYLRYLAQFLDDETIRDNTGQTESDAPYDGPSAALNYPRIAVRDYAAMLIGQTLKLPNAPRQKWTAEEWAEYRERVKTALQVVETSSSPP